MVKLIAQHNYHKAPLGIKTLWPEASEADFNSASTSASTKTEGDPI